MKNRLMLFGQLTRSCAGLTLPTSSCRSLCHNASSLHTHTHTPFHFFVTMARKMSWAVLAVTAGILWERFSVEYKSFWKLSLWFPLQNAFLLWPPPCPSYTVGTACSHLTGSHRPGWGSCPLPSAQLCCWDEEILKATACFVEWSTFEFWSGI